MLDFPAESLVFWGAVAAVGLAFTGFAGLFAAALHEGTNAYAAQMGAETSRQFEDVFLFVTPKSSWASPPAPSSSPCPPATCACCAPAAA